MAAAIMGEHTRLTLVPIGPVCQHPQGFARGGWVHVQQGRLDLPTVGRLTKAGQQRAQARIALQERPFG